MDPFVLAGQIQADDAQKAVDIGCGCGIISLLVARKFPGLKIIGIDIDKKMADHAKKNAAANTLDSQIKIIHKDINIVKTEDLGGRVDLVVSNPPYKKRGTGRLNPNSQKAIARHEITLDINQLFLCAGRLLKARGKLYIILPILRIPDLEQAMSDHGFFPISIQKVILSKNRSAERVILCAGKNKSQTCLSLPSIQV